MSTCYLVLTVLLASASAAPDTSRSRPALRVRSHTNAGSSLVASGNAPGSAPSTVSKGLRSGARAARLQRRSFEPAARCAHCGERACRVRCTHR
jgi:hypothetical protein